MKQPSNGHKKQEVYSKIEKKINYNRDVTYSRETSESIIQTCPFLEFSVCSTLAGGPPQQVIVQAQVPPPPHGIPHLGHPHLISANPPPASSPQPLMTTVQPELVPTSLPLWGSSAPGAMPTQQIIQQVQLSLYFVCILYFALHVSVELDVQYLVYNITIPFRFQ